MSVGTHPAFGHLREDLGITLPSNEGVDHLPPRSGQHARRYRRQLEPGVFKDLVKPLGLLGAFLDLGRSVPGRFRR